MLQKKFATLAVATLMLAATGAQAEVVDFNNLAGTDMPGGYNGLAYTYFANGVSQHAGFSFVTPQQPHWYAGAINSAIFCGGAYGYCANNSTDYLLVNATLRVARTTGATFSLNGLDLDNYYDGDASNPAQTSFVISATQAGGQTITQRVTLDNLPNTATFGTAAAFNHFSLSGFTNITSFQVERETENERLGFAMDNMDVTLTSAVPEPSTWAMLAVGLAGLVLRRKLRSA